VRRLDVVDAVAAFLSMFLRVSLAVFLAGVWVDSGDENNKK
jgi:hypothetical protein